MTALVIAHKLATICNADRITVMRRGVAVETGTHDQLLRKKGFYHSMFNAQMGIEQKQ